MPVPSSGRRLTSDRRAMILGHSDADGLSALAILAQALERSPRSRSIITSPPACRAMRS